MKSHSWEKRVAHLPVKKGVLIMFLGLERHQDDFVFISALEPEALVCITVGCFYCILCF